MDSERAAMMGILRLAVHEQLGKPWNRHPWTLSSSRKTPEHPRGLTVRLSRPV